MQHTMYCGLPKCNGLRQMYMIASEYVCAVRMCKAYECRAALQTG